MLFALLAAAALAPGVITAVRLRHHGWPLAALAGGAVTVCMPLLLISSILVFPPLGFVVSVPAVWAALNAYEEGRIWHGTAWAGLAIVACWCTGWSL